MRLSSVFDQPGLGLNINCSPSHRQPHSNRPELSSTLQPTTTPAPAQPYPRPIMTSTPASSVGERTFQNWCLAGRPSPRLYSSTHTRRSRRLSSVGETLHMRPAGMTRQLASVRNDSGSGGVRILDSSGRLHANWIVTFIAERDLQIVDRIGPKPLIFAYLRIYNLLS